MKTRHLLVATATALAVLTSGCMTQAPVMNTVDVTQVDYSTPIQKQKDCAYFILMFMGPFGQASMMDAIKAGGFSKVKGLEYSESNYFLWRETCNVVYGE